MRLKLEVLGIEDINYTDKVTKAPRTFQVTNCREASPATVLTPIRLSTRDHPNVKPGTVVEFEVTDCTKGKLDSALSMRGHVVSK